MTEDRRTTETMTDQTHEPTAGRRPTGRETKYRPTLGEVSHTNPYTGAVFGDTQTYSRGRTVAADGGEPEAVPEDDEQSPGVDDGNRQKDEGPSGAESETLEDVDHTPAGEVDGAQDSFDRGEETTSEPDDE